MITRLSVTNWRAYDSREFTFEPGITFLVGRNGTGKTSILEAIAYALTGEPATVAQRGLLLRDPALSATVALRFRAENEDYEVERGQSATRAEQATLIRCRDDRLLARAQKQVAGSIADLLGASADFLRRVTYMPEGDVVRFLELPPGDALDEQMRQMLGFSHLDLFVASLDAAGKRLGPAISEASRLMARCDALGIKEASEFDLLAGAADRRRGELLAALTQAHEEIATRQAEEERFARLGGLLARAVAAGGADGGDEWGGPITAIEDRLAARMADASALAATLRQQVARAEGERATYEDSAKLLQRQAGLGLAPLCPLCGKPMDEAEQQEAVARARASVDRLSADVLGLEQQVVRADTARGAIRVRLEPVRALAEAVSESGSLHLRPDVNLADLTATVALHGPGGANPAAGRAAELRRQLAELDAEVVAYPAIRAELRAAGYAGPDELADHLVSLEIRSLSLRAALRAARETVSARRNADMGPLYAHLADMWQAFRGEIGWHIALGANGSPTLQDPDGRTLVLSQFSGGEKTVLLIMLHMAMARHFAPRCGLLLIDEPLEHLDPINRRGVVRYLVEAHRAGLYEQAIVATCEESLVRGYVGEDGVNLMLLP